MSLSGHRETWVPVALYAVLASDAGPVPVFVTRISELEMVRVRELVLATRAVGVPRAV